MSGEEKSSAGAQPPPAPAGTPSAASVPLVEAVQRLVMTDDPSPRHKDKRLEALQKRHPFWETQPVVQFTEERAPPAVSGPIEPPDASRVRAEGYPLPPSFEWCTVDMADEAQATEVYQLLTANYVEDDDAMFRFDYSLPFLRWALQPPGFKPSWHVGVRATPSHKLVAFISGTPATIRAGGPAEAARPPIRVAEINFLCVHKKLRAKRLAPVLIKEVTRRVNADDVWQAVYTAGVVLPLPIAVCRYWHRSLQPKKLVEVGFSRVPHNSTLARLLKLYKLPPAPPIAGVRPMAPGDVPAVAALLKAYLEGLADAPAATSAASASAASAAAEPHAADPPAARAPPPPPPPPQQQQQQPPQSQGDAPPPPPHPQLRFPLHPVLDEAEVSHWLLPRSGVVSSYVVESSPGGAVTDFFSFYSLPSTVINHPVHSTLRAAYCYYYAPGAHTAGELLHASLCCAAKEGFDVFNALDILANTPELLRDLKFGIGDGHLQFYLFNWRAAAPLTPQQVGIVML